MNNVNVYRIPGKFVVVKCYYKHGCYRHKMLGIFDTMRQAHNFVDSLPWNMVTSILYQEAN